ncbi:MAG: 16S rRNA (guanine(527)-N(7))-methyltransferase RsmG [Atribacterota bacterium]
MDKLRKLLRDGETALCVHFTNDQEEKILAFVRLLHEANERLNLTGFKTEEAILTEGVLDSLTASTFSHILEKTANLIDVGTGGGIPGIPLKIVYPTMQLALLEATAKKCRFLEEAVRTLELEDVSILCGRAETLAHDPALRERFALATARALGELREILELTIPFVRPQGFALYYKGQNAQKEVKEAQNALSILKSTVVALQSVSVPFLPRKTTLILVGKEAPTPPQYPRRPGIPKKRPL